MTTIVTRAGKGSELTFAEMDANFTNLNNDKMEKDGAAVQDNVVKFSATGDAEDSGVAITLVQNENAWPVGSIYMNATNGVNPSALLGFGTWSALAPGRVLLGHGTSTNDDQPVPESRSFVATNEGGEFSHTLTEAELASHTHNVTAQKDTGGHTAGGDPPDEKSNTQTFATSSAGNDEAHNNMQPYLVVYMWVRTA